jgi:hypothetical protein
MLFGYILLLIALTISSVAAFYSIAGLTAIFAAAFWPIVIMGGVLELGKVATTVWLHKYWEKASWQFKAYLVPAIAILMLITSMGIFGFLSKAHLDQAVPAGDISSQVQIFDDKIKTQKDNIEAARKALTQMDAQVDQKLSRTTDDKGAERAVQIRRSQAKERSALQNEISAAQKVIVKLQEERAPVASQARKVEAEVGPIKYIAALIYGDNPDANLLEKAVRWVIILIVLVFDPLALVLILAADQTFEWHRPRKKLPFEIVEDPKEEKDEPKDDPKDQPLDMWNKMLEAAEKEARPTKAEEVLYEPDDGPLTDEEIEEIKQASGVDQDMEMQEFFDRGKKIARELDAKSAIQPTVEEPVVEVIKEPSKIIHYPEVTEDGTVDWTTIHPDQEYVTIYGQKMNVRAAKGLYPQKTATPSSYVQNEEQGETSRWKELTAATQISEKDYYAATEKNLDEIVASVRDGRLPLYKVPYEIQEAVKERLQQ